MFDEKYFYTNNDSSILAFTTPKNKVNFRFQIVGSHSDSPGFRIKPIHEKKIKGDYIRIDTEVYGGPIVSTWFDRPLSASGRVVLKSDNPLKPKVKLIDYDKDLMIIPNQCIHMNRELNNGYKYNYSIDTLPIMGMSEKDSENYLLKNISEILEVSADDILDFDLYLYPREKSTLLGLNDEFISAPRLDNLAMAHASYRSFVESFSQEAVNVFFVSDNEEVGSMSIQGADSTMLSDSILRISKALGFTDDEYFEALGRSFMISADQAHAVHPNLTFNSDDLNYPIINHGPVIKYAANKAYTSDGLSASIFRQIAEKAGMPIQVFTNRSDKRGGSTIGPISQSHINILSLDIGNPILAMHSIRELGGVKDHYYLYEILKEFYNL